MFYAVAFGLRTYQHLRSTGSAGFHGLSGRPGSAEWWGGALFGLGVLLSLLAPIAGLLGWATSPTTSPIQHTLGVTAVLLGIAATYAAQISMGRSWRIGVRSDERTALVTHGPFALVRNPIFSCMLWTASALVVLLPTVVRGLVPGPADTRPGLRRLAPDRRRAAGPPGRGAPPPAHPRYRILRNAVIDPPPAPRGHVQRRLAALAAELDTTEPDDEVRGAVCQCVARLADNLKPEYAEALRRIEVDGLAVKDYAAEVGITRQQRRGARVPGPRSAEEAGRPLLRDLRRARLPRLHLRRGTLRWRSELTLRDYSEARAALHSPRLNCRTSGLARDLLPAGKPFHAPHDSPKIFAPVRVHRRDRGPARIVRVYPWTPRRAPGRGPGPGDPQAPGAGPREPPGRLLRRPG
jgi:protein-S-isoprenylcysteine O-methyltransferase Ste14